MEQVARYTEQVQETVAYRELVFAIFPRFDMKVPSTSGDPFEIYSSQVGICYESGEVEIVERSLFMTAHADAVREIGPNKRSGTYLMSSGQLRVISVDGENAVLFDEKTNKSLKVPRTHYDAHFFPVGPSAYASPESLSKAKAEPVNLSVGSIRILNALRAKHGWSLQTWLLQLD